MNPNNLQRNDTTPGPFEFEVKLASILKTASVILGFITLILLLAGPTMMGMVGAMMCVIGTAVVTGLMVAVFSIWEMQARKMNIEAWRAAQGR
ncbi:hypothetical protein [Corynebacterium phoceense]|uniref:hypothetical protein n=1 Tax=Corynebacterium phoceense TaxID=1686286 RepID=UPI0018AB4274|nr:hypothetical protein [Corynebacterium phoceense]MBF9011319.1 hypothetical protein [Corynebacterium phoceense]